MALNKIKSMIQKISESPNVKKIIDDVQSKTSELEKSLKKVNTEQAVIKYKQLMKMVSSKEAQLHKEVNSAVNKAKKTVHEVEKNLESYKKKAEQQKNKIEKMLLKKAPKKKTTSKASPKTVKKAAPKTSRKKAQKR